MGPCSGHGNVMRTFFKNITNNWPIWADRRNKSQHTFFHCVSLLMIFDVSTKKLSIKTFQRKLYLGLSMNRAANN